MVDQEFGPGRGSLAVPIFNAGGKVVRQTMLGHTPGGRALNVWLPLSLPRMLAVQSQMRRLLV